MLPSFVCRGANCLVAVYRECAVSYMGYRASRVGTQEVGRMRHGKLGEVRLVRERERV